MIPFLPLPWAITHIARIPAMVRTSWASILSANRFASLTLQSSIFRGSSSSVPWTYTTNEELPRDHAQRTVPGRWPNLFSPSRTQDLGSDSEKPHHSSDTRMGLSPAQPGEMVPARARAIHNETTATYRIYYLQ